MRVAFAMTVSLIGLCPLSVLAADSAPGIELSFKQEAVQGATSVHVADLVLVRSADVFSAASAEQGEINLQPGPGQYAIVNRQDVVAAIGRVDSTLLTRLKWSGSEQISVGKLGRWLDTNESTARAEQALQQWLGERVKNAELQQHAIVDRKWVEAGAQIRYVVPTKVRIQRQMPVQVEITDVNGKSRSFPIWFTVSAMQDVWVLTRDIAADEMILFSDLILQTMDITALEGESIPSDFAPSDQMIVSPVKAGSVLLKSQVKPRPDVMVGETVAVKLNEPMVQLEATGLALQSAERGSRVLIRNTSSGENLVARVTDRDVVEVGP